MDRFKLIVASDELQRARIADTLRMSAKTATDSSGYSAAAICFTKIR
jgi:hypothetical protein